MENHDTTKLARLISQRRQSLLQLRDLGLKQANLIAAGEIASLLKLLAVKQQLIAAVQKIESELEPYRNDDPESRAWPSREERVKCAAQAEECRQLIEDIMRTEKANEDEMVRRQQEVARQLKTVNAAQKARRAYCGDVRYDSAPASAKSPHVAVDGRGIDIAT